MPIARHLRKFYTTPSYRAARKSARARAGNKCQWCEKPNGVMVYTRSGKEVCVVKGQIRERPRMFWRTSALHPWRNQDGWIVSEKFPEELELLESFPKRRIRSKCGAAHLNHTAGDDRAENIVFICDWCHLNYDQPEKKRTRSMHKDEKRPLLQVSA